MKLKTIFIIGAIAIIAFGYLVVHLFSSVW